ncbi:hypothetical protein DL96DRAFT_497478 [Flagelloscypha sp. PMI_526]|nr:hypothetical protein DL96DRAFT_497478 [Flagelloscypha sp. PMI_526]
MGWTLEIDISAKSCPGVAVPKPLNDRGWDVLKASLLPTLRRNLQNWRIAARQGSVIQAYDSFFEKDQEKPLFPSFNTFRSFDSVREIAMVPPKTSTPELEPFKANDEAAWEVACPKIVEDIQDYRSRVTSHAKMLLAYAYIDADLLPPPDFIILTDPRSLFRVSTMRLRTGYIFNQVRAFPIIHEVMRDRQNIGIGEGEGRAIGTASEFLVGEEMLMVDLEAWKHTERETWVKRGIRD